MLATKKAGCWAKSTISSSSATPSSSLSSSASSIIVVDSVPHTTCCKTCVKRVENENRKLKEDVIFYHTRLRSVQRKYNDLLIKRARRKYRKQCDKKAAEADAQAEAESQVTRDTFSCLCPIGGEEM